MATLTISRLLRGPRQPAARRPLCLNVPPKCRILQGKSAPERFARYRSQLVQRCAGCGSDLCGSGGFRACPLRSDQLPVPWERLSRRSRRRQGPERLVAKWRGCGGERRAGYLDSGGFYRDAQRPFPGPLSRNPGPEPQRWGCDLARAIRAHPRAARGRRRAAHRTPDRRGDRHQAQRSTALAVASCNNSSKCKRRPTTCRDGPYISLSVRGVPARRAECRSLLVPGRRGACVVCGLGLSRGNAWKLSTGVLSIPTCNVPV